MEAGGSGSVPELVAGVRLVVLNLPEDEGEGLGFRLTRTLWDPYPWVREVVPASRADNAGLKTGDCLLQADGKDLLGLPVGQVAGLIRGDGAGRGVSLLVWNCGVDPNDDPELLWSCGGGSRGEKSRRALAGVVKALSCCVCAATAVRALNCARSHLYCEACWKRLERCALCRETLPSKDSPYARNLVAEQVFEAIATEYELKETMRRPTESVSAVPSPNRSPSGSPFVNRKGHHQPINRNKTKKAVQFNDKFGQNYASDPNLHRTTNQDYNYDRRVQKTTNIAENSYAGNTGGSSKCNCQSSSSNSKMEARIPKILIENAEDASNDSVQHKLVTRLRQACSLADLNNVQPSACLTGSLNNINLKECNAKVLHSTSMDNIKASCGSIPESASVFVLSTPPIYVLTCDHNNK